MWSVNPCFGIAGELSFAWDQATGDAMATAIAALTPGTTMRAWLSTTASLQNIRLEGRSDTGELLGIAQAVKGSSQAGTGTASKPFQTAAVISLRTNTPGGRGRGRLYWPALGATIVNTTLRINPADVTTFASEARTYLAAISAALATAGGFPPTASCPLIVRSTTGVFETQVNRLQVGDVLDVQRRRRDKAPENYTSLPYPS